MIVYSCKKLKHVAKICNDDFRFHPDHHHLSLHNKTRERRNAQNDGEWNEKNRDRRCEIIKKEKTKEQ